MPRLEMGFYIKEDNTELIKHATKTAIKRALKEVGLQAERNAKKEVTRAVYNTPPKRYKRTGDLRNYITHGDNGVDTAYVGDSVDYASYVEYGTIKMPARPFIKPAVANYTGEYKEIFEDNLRNA